MNKFIKLILGWILVPVLLQAQVTGDQLVGLGVESTLASKIASIGNSSSTKIRAGAGTAALPSYSYYSDSDTGQFNLSANTLAWSCGGTEELQLSATRLQPTTNGGLSLGSDTQSFQDLFIIGVSTTGNGTAAAPAYSFDNYANMGMYAASANTLGISTSGALKWSVDSTGQFIGAGTATIGWAVVDGTDNTACSSQCTAPAVFGFNLAGGATAPVIVSPGDATADICLCAGAS